jgi:hypothetical protein
MSAGQLRVRARAGAPGWRWWWQRTGTHQVNVQHVLLLRNLEQRGGGCRLVRSMQSHRVGTERSCVQPGRGGRAHGVEQLAGTDRVAPRHQRRQHAARVLLKVRRAV